VISLLIFVISLGLAAGFSGSAEGFTFVRDSSWISSPPIRYHVGIDGLSRNGWCSLTTLLTPISVLASWKPHPDHRVKGILRVPDSAGIRQLVVRFAGSLHSSMMFWEVGHDCPCYFPVDRPQGP